MTRIVQGPQLVKAIEQLAETAETALVLASPYFDPWEEIEDAIEDALERDVQVVLGVRADNARACEAADYFGEQGADVYYIEDLHAKVYVSEQRALMTSMNILVSSANKAVEIGTIFDASSDQGEFRKVIAQSSKMAPSIPWKIVSSPSRSSRSKTARRDTRQASTSAFCIRCAEEIEYDLRRPFCDKHWRTWSRHEDPNYEERYCHVCGGRANTCQRLPKCDDCYHARVASGSGRRIR